MAAAELRELRARITIETDAALDAVAGGSGLDRSEIAREVLHKWALQQMATATLLKRRLVAEGIEAADERRQSGGSKARAASHEPDSKRGGQ